MHFARQQQQYFAQPLERSRPERGYRLIDSGELAGKKVGNKYRTTDAACIAYLNDPRDPVVASAGEHIQVWESRRDAAIRRGKEPPPYADKPISQATKSQHLSFMRSL